MGYYVIIRGPLGIGKSTIAKMLARRLRGEYVSIDLLLKKYGLDKIEGKCIPLKNFIKVNETIAPRLKKKLNEGKVVIIDGNFYHKKQIEHLTKKVTLPHFVFTLKAPLSACIRRDSNRQREYGKSAAKEVYKLVSRFDCGIPINANKAADHVVKDILSYLPKDDSSPTEKP